MKGKKILLSVIVLLALCGCGQTAKAEEKMQETVAARVETRSKEDPEKEEKTIAADEKETGAKASAKAPKTAVKKTEAKKDAVEKDSAKPEEKKLPEYTVETFEEAKIMYAADAVNVRKGPTTDFDRVGFLNRAQEVTVMGQADTGWYEITLGDENAFVSDHYLLNEKPAEQPAAEPVQAAAAPETPQQQQPTQPVTEVKNVAGVILVGDSRFVQMQANVGENSCTWIAESGKGYKWFNDNAVSRIDGCVGNGSKIIINLGVNDPGNLNNYLTLVNTKAAEWVSKGAVVYYASVNPVWENPYVTEEQVEYFNSQMQGGLSGDVHWIDSISYLNTIGYKLVDGLHYNSETYQNLYAYFMSCL